MERLVRGFPDRAIPVDRFPPSIIRFHKTVSDELAAQGRAKLTLSTTTPGKARVFVNDHFATGQEPHVMRLVPGEYRVFAVTRHGVSRMKLVTVAANDDTAVTVDTVFDTAVRVSSRVALRFSDEATRARHQDGFAVRLAQAAQLADGVIVLRVGSVAGVQAVIGKVMDGQGAMVRHGYVRVDDDPPVSRLQALAGYLAGDEPGPGVQVMTPDAPPPMSDDGGSGRIGGWKWLALGVGVTGLVAGAYAVSIDGDGTCSDAVTCPEIYTTRTPGYVALGVGAVAVAAGVAAYFYDRRADRRERLSIIPAVGDRHWSLALSGRF
jgi:hypothetical protein